jgi:small GTP-binding protein
MATNKDRQGDEQKKKLGKDLLQSILRKSERPRNLRDLGVSTLRNLPANIGMVQGLMKAVNWRVAQEEVLQNLNNTVVIVGRPNTGKSTLFNKIKGQQLSLVSAQPGSTRSLVRTDFGPFTLVDTPGIDVPQQIPNMTESGLEQASVIVFLMDATQPSQSRDRELYQILQKLDKPIILAVNKVDAVDNEKSADQVATDMAIMLGTAGVIPVSAKTGLNIAEELLPEIINASPEAALVIGRELPAFRRAAAQRIIRNATLVSLAAGIEPIPFVDIPILLGTQIRLVLRIAALYGENMNAIDTLKYARELVVTMLGGLGFRYLAEQAAKAVPFGGDFVAGAIAAAATWSIGEVALEYYENGKEISPTRLRLLYEQMYKRFRRDNTAQKLRNQALNGNQPLSIPERVEEEL